MGENGGKWICCSVYFSKHNDIIKSFVAIFSRYPLFFLYFDWTICFFIFAGTSKFNNHLFPGALIEGIRPTAHKLH